ncbi:MAG: sugar-binding domain-containing protein [Enterococcus lemanii]|jgi:beta-galactosidase
MREKINLNKSWRFYLGEIGIPRKIAKKAHALGGYTASLPGESGEIVTYSAGGEHFLKLIAQGDVKQGLKNLASTDFDSQMNADWLEVTLPHDWKPTQPYTNQPALLMSGFKEEGVAYYRKTFTLDERDYSEKRVILHFDGVMRSADVWLNGAYLGQNNSGYTDFSFDITEMSLPENEGSNVLLVRVDTTTGTEGWWYEGAGIYKDVWLEVLPTIRINQESAYIYTKNITSNEAEMGLELTLENETGNQVEVTPEVTIGTQVLSFAPQTIAPYGQVQVKQDFTVKQPKLWTPETPFLYEASFAIATDSFKKNFGIRTFAYDEAGFYLNGARYELRGVCEHQDFAGVGVALNQDLVDYKIQTMKAIGVNAWRSAHHFASKELLSACDREGILLMNENRLLECTPWRIADLEKMVIQTRMHASVAFWSVANEEVIGNTPLGNRIAKRLVRVIKENNYESLVVSAELLNPEGTVDAAYLANYDVLGVNYPEAAVMGPGAVNIKKQYPNKAMMSTESASYFSTRGVYRDDAEVCACSNLGSMYSMVLPGKRQVGDPGVGGTAHPEQVMQYLKNQPYMGGVFLWTAFDYYGEPSPFGWPAISSQFGIVDLCGFPKDYYYYYQAHWTSEPMVHVMPHWNAEGLEIDEKGQVTVRVFSNLLEVELFVNEKSYGKKVVIDGAVDWCVLYEPGELKVVALKENATMIKTTRKTSKQIDKVKTTKVFAGKDINLYQLTAVDETGIFVPTADEQVFVTVKEGTILAVANGNPVNHEVGNVEQVRLFKGQALVVVKRSMQDPEVIAQI